MKLKILVPAALAVLRLALPPPAGAAGVDGFGVAKLYDTVSGGKEWSSTWGNGVARTIGFGDDPRDSWLHGRGNATYAIDGAGVMRVSGSTPRLYVHDPAKTRSWGDVEMTAYAMRVSDSGTAYGGIVGVARTNHTNETANPCDSRGTGARFRYDGRIDLEKETKHPSSVPTQNKPAFAGGLPYNKWIGWKLVVRDLPNGNVKLENYMDLTDGLNGGTWTKVNEIEDNGSNFGAGGVACRNGVNPALRLRAGDNRQGSETGKPNLAVYFRSDNVGTNGLLYKKMSVREVSAAPAVAPSAGAPVLSAVGSSGVGPNGAMIAWTSDVPGDTQVEYGPTAAYGQSTSLDSVLTTNHVANLLALTPSTLYHYRVKSRGAGGILTTSGDYTFTTPAAPAAGTLVTGSFYDDFKTYPKGTCYPDGASFGPWTSAFGGYGCTKMGGDATISWLEEAPAPSVTAAETHASMVLGPRFQGPQTYSFNLRTVAHTRVNSAPNPWEVAWIAWNYTDDVHFYYFALKPNGWELGKEDPAYPGAQRFLASGSSPAFPIGPWHNVRVEHDSTNTIKVFADDVLLVTFKDAERPYTSGRVGFYNEDSRVQLKDVSVVPETTVAAIGPSAAIPSRAPQRLLSPAKADGINDAAVFGAAASEVAVYDISGRRVFQGSRSGSAPLVWNARDGSGRVVESGVYIARIRDSGDGVVYQSFVVAK